MMAAVEAVRPAAHPPQRPAAHPPQGPGKAPVQLEANRNGRWHKVVEFDANDPLAEELMRAAVELLGAIDRRVAFRVVTRDVAGHTLLTYSNEHGWNPA